MERRFRRCLGIFGLHIYSTDPKTRETFKAKHEYTRNAHTLARVLTKEMEEKFYFRNLCQ